MKQKVVVYLRGGLGNQLFQYFTGLDLARTFSKQLVIKTSLLPSKPFTAKNGVSVFPEEISSFHFEGCIRHGLLEMIAGKYWARYLYSRFAQLDRILGSIFPSAWGLMGRMTDDHSTTQTHTRTSAQTLVVNSLCLSFDAAQKLKPQDLSSLCAIRSPSPWFKDQLSRIEKQKPVSLHLRLGDHFTLDPQIDLDYVNRALKYLEGAGLNREIWVFSDDPKFAKIVLGGLGWKFSFVEPTSDSRPIESLVLMSRSSALITSKSTYSYWSAILADPIGAEIILNLDWTRQPNPPTFLLGIPNSWVRV